ncbi:MAG: hypothetical protein U1B30_05360, partial [Pseudomonadota bacterium]|nr:hypothetical protein [Pseudomonadota bacterium]
MVVAQTLPSFIAQPFGTFLYVIVDDVSRLDALFHAFACASVGFAFALILHLQIAAGAFGQRAFSAGHKLHHGSVYGLPEGFCVWGCRLLAVMPVVIKSARSCGFSCELSHGCYNPHDSEDLS